MRLQLILPRVDPTKITPPVVCRYKGYKGRFFEFWQEVDKALRDTVYPKVKAHRYKCLRCKGTFGVYPQGVNRAKTSQRVYGLVVMLYLLGLSYGAVSPVLEALGVYLCKSWVYEVVQAAAERVPGLKRERVFEDIQTPALGGDITSVKCSGRWLPAQVATWALQLQPQGGQRQDRAPPPKRSKLRGENSLLQSHRPDQAYGACIHGVKVCEIDVLSGTGGRQRFVASRTASPLYSPRSAARRVLARMTKPEAPPVACGRHYSKA